MGRVMGPKSASARPGPCTWPRLADALTRREYHPARQASASSSFVLGRPSPASWDGPRAAGGLRALHLDPGSGRMVPVTRVGRSALRAAAPAGRGHCRAGLPTTLTRADTVQALTRTSLLHKRFWSGGLSVTAGRPALAMVGVCEFGLVRSKATSSSCRRSAYGNEGIALTLLGAEDRAGYFVASGGR
jgi:hypothetical protein